MQYKVYYNQGLPGEEFYGLYDADSEYNAIEQVVAQDTYRNSLKSVDVIYLRHEGMSAEQTLLEPELKQQTEEKIEETNQHVKVMEDSFKQLQKLYEENMNELSAFKSANSFGATYHYKDNKTKFVPIFVLNDDIELDGEKPYKYTLNFDQQLLAFWITAVSKHVIKRDPRDDEL